MAIANSYPMGTPKSDDLLLGTSVPTPNTNEKATTKNFALSQVGALVNTVNLGYTSYVANLDAAAGIAPTATILQNTTGLTFTWTRTGTGQFVATVAGTPFAANKFWAMTSAKVPQLTSIVRTSTNTARLDVIESQNGNALNTLVEGYIEIRIYS